MKIPKIIHYFYDDSNIWEKNTKSQVRMCINSWLKHCSNYKLMLWHDKMPEFQNIISRSLFAKRAYELKLWAFVADYVRYYALYKYGGIYLDTDVEVLRNFDEFLENKFFASIEGDILFGENIPEPAIMGAIPNHRLLLECMKIYESEGIFEIDNFIANVIMKKVLKEQYQFERLNYKSYDLDTRSNKFYNKDLFCNQLNDFELYKNQCIWQDVNNEVTLYPCEYFCPTWAVFRQNAFTNNTVTIHWNQSTWHDNKKLDLFKNYKKPISVIIQNQENVKKKENSKRTNILQSIFSIKNSKDRRHKVITVCNLRIKIKRGKNK